LGATAGLFRSSGAVTIYRLKVRRFRLGSRAVAADPGIAA